MSAEKTETYQPTKSNPINTINSKKITKHIWIIRHAQSMANAVSEAPANYPGVKDSDLVNTCLSEEGKKQAAHIQGPVDLLIVSPLRRTLETYIYSKLKVKRLFTSELIREYRAPSGDFELEESEIETVGALQSRVLDFIKLLKSQPETKIGILSHGVFLMELTKQLGRPLDSYMKNAQVIYLANVEF